MVPSEREEIPEQRPDTWEPGFDWPALGLPLARPVLCDLPITSPQPAEPFLLGSTSRPAAWADVGILIGSALALEVLALPLVAWLMGIDRPIELEERRRVLIPFLFIRALALSTLIAVVLRVRGQGLATVGLRRQGCGVDLALALATLGTAVGCMYVVMFPLVLLWPLAREQMIENTQRLTEMVPRMPIAGYVVLMLVVGGYEELFFRGFLLPRLRRAFGSWVVAIVLTTILFTLPHAADQTWIALIPITIMSIVFCIITAWRKSILPAAGAHTIFNLSVLMYLDAVMGPERT